MDAATEKILKIVMNTKKGKYIQSILPHVLTLLMQEYNVPIPILLRTTMCLVLLFKTQLEYKAVAFRVM